MKDLLKSVKLFKKGVHIVQLRDLTLDDVNVEVVRHQANSNRTRESTVSVKLSLHEDDLILLATTLGVSSYRKENDLENRPLHFNNYAAMSEFAQVWDLTPKPFYENKRAPTGYSRKRTDASRAACIDDANALMDAVDVEPLKEAALARMNETLVRVIKDANDLVKSHLDNILGKLNVDDEWLANQIEDANSDEVTVEHHTLSVNLESMKAERDALDEKIVAARQAKCGIERKLIKDSLLKSACGDKSTVALIESIKPQSNSSIRAFID